MTTVAEVYAQALYDLARDESICEEILQQLDAIRSSLDENGAYLSILANPAVAKAERLALLDEAFRNRVHPYLLNFLKLMTEKGRIRCFSECCVAYRAAYNADHNILTVYVTSAAPLTGEQAHRITSKLKEITGKDIEMTGRVEPGFIGGVRVDFAGTRLDDSIRGRLERLSKALKNVQVG